MQTFADFSKKTPNYLHNPKNLRTFARNFRVCGFTRTRKIRKKSDQKAALHSISLPPAAVPMGGGKYGR
jgi:hypothetical protein